MAKIKILFFLPQLVGGGAERVTINIMEILNKDVFEIHLAVADSKGPAYKFLPLEITLHDLKTRRTIYSISKIRSLVQKLRPNIIFSSLIRGHIAIDWALMFLKSSPYIIFRSPNSPKLLAKNKELGLVQKHFLEKAYKKANIIVAQTPEMEKELVEYHKVDKEKVRFLLNPIDTLSIQSKINNCRNPFDLNFINVVAAGRLVEQKGFDFLIKSFYKVVTKNPLFRLHIIGEDTNDNRSKLQSLVKSMNLENHIEFLGFQQNPYKFFKYANLYVLSSRWEGLPNTVLECLYLRTPVISTRCIPFMDNLIEVGESGFLVDVDDEIGMFNAILNYNKIKLNFKESGDHTKRINEFFSKVNSIS